MVDKICDYLTNKIKNQMPEVDDERAEIINYGLHLVIGEIPKTFVFIAIAAILEVLKEFFITMLVIFPYRAFSGGVHLKTHFGCIAVTSLFYCGTAFISQFYMFDNITKYVLLFCVWVFGIIMSILYAPADTESVPILRRKERKFKKIASCIVLTMTIIVGVIINNYVISNIIIIGTFMQSLMISRFAYKITNNKYGYEVYLEEQRKVNNAA